MATRFMGSQIQVVFQVNFPTFTPDQFNQVLKEKGFLLTSSQMVNPQGQAVQMQMFSKGNLIVFFAPVPQNPSQFQVVFQALNTVSLAVAPSGGVLIQDIRDILKGLNIVEDVISLIAFNCTTRETVKIDPAKGLTAGIKPKLLQKIAGALGTDLNVTSLRLGTSLPLLKGTQIILEPLISDPTKQFYINVIFQTNDMKEFDTFIKGFGEELILSITEAIMNA
jgi:hypothetical protein